MKVWTKIKSFLLNNLTVWLFAFFSIVLEMISNCFIDSGKPYLTRPWYCLALCSFLCLIMIIVKNKKAQVIIGTVILLCQTVLSVGLAFLYFCNGTFFEWSMINMRTDANGTIEKVQCEWGLMAICLVCCVLYVVFGVFYIQKTTDGRIKALRKSKKGKSFAEQRLDKKIVVNEIRSEERTLPNYKKRKAIFYSVTSSLMVGMFLIVSLIPLANGLDSMKRSYVDKLYGSSENVYQQRGVSSNAVYECAKGLFTSKATTDDLERVEPFIYAEKADTTKYNGISKGNNLIVVLVESFEWYTWLAGEHNDYDEAVLKQLYPNLYKFYENSLSLTNFRQREKTDTSEILSLIGSNPTNKYANYDFPENAYPWSLPNVLKDYAKNVDGKNYLTQSFHQNSENFYNRKTLHKSFGFDRSFFIEQMEENYGVVNTWDENNWDKGERTPDSLTWDAMKEEMVPSDEKMKELGCDNFYTFAITFAMHGYYVERENLKNALNGENYYETLDSVYDAKHDVTGVYPYDEEDDVKEVYYRRNYAAAVMDFDRALGVLMQRLKDTGHENDTTVILYADHNTYYNDLAYFAKGIDVTDDRYNAELFRIPCMIYDTKLVNEYKKNNDGRHTLNKFTTTADLIPTVFDIFGIPAWKNMYFGSSVFSDNESIIYSRSYGLFVTDKLAGYSVNKLKYVAEDFTDADLEDFIARATVHLNKLEILDKIYFSDYFSDHNYKKAYSVT